ncbi:DUF5954 family protein [Micromonospora sp. NPDC048839]|uniref:DUF5954 family protein n=1 Tax=Micromonospora sp. NPDC048839 TaxID=3155641 RepID=UPI0033DE67E0
MGDVALDGNTPFEEVMAAYERARAAHQPPRTDDFEVQGVPCRVTRVEIFVRVGPDGPEGPRPSGPGLVSTARSAGPRPSRAGPDAPSRLTRLQPRTASRAAYRCDWQPHLPHVVWICRTCAYRGILRSMINLNGHRERP